MIRRLPRWAWHGAWLLAFVAGCVNAVCLLGLGHQATSHLTGNTSLLSAAVAAGEFGPTLGLAALLVAFVFGAAVSGLLIQDESLRLGRRYGAVLLIEALMLFVAAWLLHAGERGGLHLAAAACGLQNGMVSVYSGAIVRTTHLTGMFTDLGLWLGHRLRGIEGDRLRLRLSLLVIGGFLFGGIAGALGHAWVGERALLLPAAMALLLALAHAAYRRRAGADGAPS